MTPTTAARILRAHNEWRRGKRDDMDHTTAELGKAIEVVCSLVERENRLAFRRLSGEHDRKGRRARLTRHREKARAGRRQYVQDDTTVTIARVHDPVVCIPYSYVSIRLPSSGKVRAK